MEAATGILAVLECLTIFLLNLDVQSGRRVPNLSRRERGVADDLPGCECCISYESQSNWKRPGVLRGCVGIAGKCE